MGFFSPKAECSVCEEQVGLNRFKDKKWICSSCFKRIGKLKKPIHTMSVEEIHLEIQNKQESNESLSPFKSPGLKSNNMKSQKTKKPFYKRWWFITIAVLLVIGIIGNLTESDEAKQKKIDQEVALELEKNKKKEDREIAKKQAETLKKEKEAKKVEVSTVAASYSKDDELNLQESYAWLMGESENLIVDIKPLNTDNYDVVYAYVVNEVKLLDDNQKQYLVDSWGNSIINLTNVNLFGGSQENPPMVNFLYQDGSSLADEKIFGGWKIKK